MLALIAGRGALPRAVSDGLTEPFVTCGLAHCPPDQVTADHLFPLERLGGFLRWLRLRGVTRVCLCGAVTRPDLSIARLGPRTLPLLPSLVRALGRGDDGALRIVIDILEGAGFEVLAAQDLVPGLLPEAGVLTRARPAESVASDARVGDRVSGMQGREDLGQACVLKAGALIAREDDAGTDAMLRALGPEAAGGLLYKAPKSGQDRRADLPVIGPRTACSAAKAGLSGIVIESEGVIVLDLPRVIEQLDAAGLFLWVRERGA